MPPRKNIAILVGGAGRGSNMEALAEACANGSLPARVVAVIAPTNSVPAVGIAHRLSLPVEVVSPGGEDYGRRLVFVLQKKEAETVCLAGYMRLLPSDVLHAFPNRVLNIHPALLPKFGGKGMYGRKVHEAVLASGEMESGCTVHLVNECYDEGRVLLQMSCTILPEDTPESLAARVLALEHEAYPAALKRFLETNGS